jgi:hypothetical protein
VLNLEAFMSPSEIGPEASRRNFFISYTLADKPWASWIAYQLEIAGYTTFFQLWDIRPGHNIPLMMSEGVALCDRLIAVLSPHYIKAPFPQAEWADTFYSDPTGAKRKLIPVRVEPCVLPPLMRAIVYVDLVNLDKAGARLRLLDAVALEVPRHGPGPFPGADGGPQFPGGTAKAVQPSPESFKEEVRRALKAANDAMIRGDYSSAVVLYLEALQFAPGNSKIRAKLEAARTRDRQMRSPE